MGTPALGVQGATLLVAEQAGIQTLACLAGTAPNLFFFFSQPSCFVTFSKGPSAGCCLNLELSLVE